MKKLFNIIAVLALTALTMPSCQMKEDDLFSTDPATRQDNWMAEYRRVFNNNQYGWALYTDNPTYGRHPAVYTYAVRFDQQNCTFYQSSSTKSFLM
jgi:predicted MFS family arabinose efflux permease